MDTTQLSLRARPLGRPLSSQRRPAFHCLLHRNARLPSRPSEPARLRPGLDRQSQAHPQRSRRLRLAAHARRPPAGARRLEPDRAPGRRSPRRASPNSSRKARTSETSSNPAPAAGRSSSKTPTATPSNSSNPPAADLQSCVARTPSCGWPAGHTCPRQHGYVGLPAIPHGACGLRGIPGAYEIRGRCVPVRAPPCQ